MRILILCAGNEPGSQRSRIETKYQIILNRKATLREKKMRRQERCSAWVVGDSNRRRAAFNCNISYRTGGARRPTDPFLPECHSAVTPPPTHNCPRLDLQVVTHVIAIQRTVTASLGTCRSLSPRFCYFVVLRLHPHSTAFCGCFNNITWPIALHPETVGWD
jgi:hypothetical protein